MTKPARSRWRQFLHDMGYYDGPPMLRKWSWEWFWNILPMLVLFAWMFLGDQIVQSFKARAISGITGLILTQAIAWMIAAPAIRARMRMYKAIKASGYLVCGHCAFDVSTLPAEGRCPECGEAYTHDECRRQWRQVL